MVNDDNNSVARLSTEKVKVSPWYYAQKILGKVLKGLIVLVLVLFMAYSFILVPTSMRYVVTEEFGAQLTKDPTIVRGGVPAGKVELATIGEDEGWLDSFGAKMRTAFTYHDGVSGVAILAGPSNRVLQNKKGEMVIDGVTLAGSRVPVNYGILEDRKWYLDNQYVALCLDGDCKAGETYIVDEGSLLGEIKNQDVPDRYAPLVDEAVRIQQEAFSKTKPLNQVDDADGNGGDAGYTVPSGDAGSRGE